MHKRFEARSRAEVVQQAEEWLKTQVSVKETTRFIFAVGDHPDSSEMNQWAVVLHYEQLRR